MCIRDRVSTQSTWGCKLGSSFLSIEARCLFDHGATYAYALRYYHNFQRIFLGTLMHSSFAHLSFNFIAQLMNGSLVEPHFGWFKFLILYWGSAITGNLFAEISKDKLIVGNSTALFGLVGSALALLFQRNLTLNKTPISKVRLILIAFTSFFTVGEQIYGKFFTPESSTIDVEGHIGGAIGGFLLTLALVETPKREIVWFYSKSIRLWGIIGYVLYLAVELGLFFLYRQPADRFLYYP
eukprot:TRINITY_DN9382_c0_g1_i5.p1 TRINITY_DN9382_c0_g1~~TRINITY_DN9382_c0_g1_i5.p1  ORF type:complete len:239 (+),score=34.71 TRINITY_DN9382_c0_g1_i5:64-780(+)